MARFGRPSSAVASRASLRRSDAPSATTVAGVSSRPRTAPAHRAPSSNQARTAHAPLAPSYEANAAVPAAAPPPPAAIEAHRLPPHLPDKVGDLPSPPSGRRVGLETDFFETDYLEVRMPWGGVSGVAPHGPLLHIEDDHDASVLHPTSGMSASPEPSEPHGSTAGRWAPQHRPLCGSFATYRLEQ